MSLSTDHGDDTPRGRVKGRKGANKIHKNQGVNPTALLTKFWEQSPNDDELIYAKYLAHVERYPSYLPGLVEYFVTNGLTNIRRAEVDKRVPPKREPTQEEIAERGARRAKVVAGWRSAVLDMVCPNGVSVRANTGTYVAKMGGAYAKLGKLVGNKIVGDVVTDEEAEKFFK